MKLVTYLQGGKRRLGRVQDNHLFPIKFNGDMLRLIQEGEQGLDIASSTNGRKLQIASVKLDVPLPNPSKIVAVGLNYSDHASEGQLSTPESPMLFSKFSSSLTGPGSEVVWSSDLTSQVDYEAELVVIIGKRARNIAVAEALDHVFGYTCGNDISARDMQRNDKQWDRAKSLDTFGPIGPWIVTRDEIADPQLLGIRSIINGQVMQDISTNRMVFSVAQLISFMSRSFTLFPGDLIFTGTPPGVGAFRQPPMFLSDGDEMIVEIEGIGQLVNYCRTI